MSLPPPPGRITAGIEAIWFVGHLGEGGVRGPIHALKEPELGPQSPPSPHHVPQSCPCTRLSKLHPPSCPCPCYLSSLCLPLLVPILSPLYISKWGRKQAGRAARAPRDPLSLSPFQLLPLATGPISLPILICL